MQLENLETQLIDLQTNPIWIKKFVNTYAKTFRRIETSLNTLRINKMRY